MPMTPETRQQFEAEERAYWDQRDELLKEYAGKWVAIVGGRVVAVGDQMSTVSHEAFRRTGSRVKFVALVGDEDIVFTIRHVATGHYMSGPRWELPLVVAEVMDAEDIASVRETFVVDTGADITILREAIADELDLWRSPATSVMINGITGFPERRMLYDAIVSLADRDVDVTCDPRDDQPHSILGRDVINHYRLTLCAKQDEVRFELVD